MTSPFHDDNLIQFPREQDGTFPRALPMDDGLTGSDVCQALTTLFFALAVIGLLVTILYLLATFS